MALTLSIPSELTELQHHIDLFCLALSSAAGGQYCSSKRCSYPILTAKGRIVAEDPSFDETMSADYRNDLMASGTDRTLLQATNMLVTCQS